MASEHLGSVIHSLQRLFGAGTVNALSEAQLLERFISHKDEAAFEAILQRHGPMVLGVCRRVLDNPQDVDDAFQATFLILVKKARSIHDRDILSTWLYGVARRVAVRARVNARRRRDCERTVREGKEVIAKDLGSSRLEAGELRSLIDLELERLPQRYRTPLVLCDLEGQTHEQAAVQLRCPVGTVKSRLARGRERLRSGLVRRGVAPTAGLLAAALGGETVSACVVPVELMNLTIRAASRLAAGEAVAAGAFSAEVAQLLKGVMASMTLSKLIPAAVVMLFFGVTAAGTWTLFGQSPASVPATPVTRLDPEKKADARPLLTNGGVEEGGGDAPTAWSQGASIPNVEYIWSRGTAHGGKASLCLKKSAQRYFPIAQWSQKIDREGDTPRLKVSAWVKAEKAGKAILDAQFIDGDGNGRHAWVAYIGAREANDPPVSHDWKRYEGVVAIPPGTKQILIAPQIYGPGTVWFDDLDAEYTNDPATDPIGS